MPSLDTGQLVAVLIANALLRIASSAGGVLARALALNGLVIGTAALAALALASLALLPGPPPSARDETRGARHET